MCRKAPFPPSLVFLISFMGGIKNQSFFTVPPGSIFGVIAIFPLFVVSGVAIFPAKGFFSFFGIGGKVWFPDT